jgi:ectoine hydroxylase-related dioxygenase (phytanoyl-CoA dioxygenase family)
LTNAARPSFGVDGFSGPHELASDEALCRARTALSNIGATPGECLRDPFESRHQDLAEVAALCTDRNVLDVVETILGEDIVLWNSVLVVKYPGSPEIPWHQDQEDELLDPVVNVVVWIALDDTRLENGALEVAPASHKQRLPHRFYDRRLHFPFSVDMSGLCPISSVALVLSMGQFVAFHTDLLHRSGPNLTPYRRAALIARYTTPRTTVASERLFSGHKIYQVRGNGSLCHSNCGVLPIHRS